MDKIVDKDIEQKEVNTEQSVTQESSMSTTKTEGNEVNNKTSEPQWTPNYKYKVYDDELEVRDVFKPLINKDNEKELIEYFRKADSFDKMFGKYKTLRTDYDSKLPEYSKKIKGYEEALQPLQWAVENKNFDALMDYLDLKEEDLQNWMRTKLSLNDEQKAIYNKSVEAQNRAFLAQQEKTRLENELKQYKQTFEEQAILATQNELENVLRQPEITSASIAWKQRTGVDNFREEVIEFAARLSDQKGYTVAPKEAVDAFIKRTGLNMSSMQIGVPTQKEQPAVLPNIQNTKVSPVKREISSLDDLRKLAESINE